MACRYYLFIFPFFFAACTVEDIKKNYPQDNPAEEFVEQKLKEYTGIDFDLSPQSNENINEQIN